MRATQCPTTRFTPALILCLVGLAAGSACAAPAVVYVDDSYTGPGNCGGHTWQTDAFSTIQEGVNAVNSGGTVNVAAGTYVEHVWVRTTGIQILGESTANTFIEPLQPPTAVVAHSGIIIVGTSIDGPGANNCRVAGFTIRNAENAVGGGLYGGKTNDWGPQGMGAVMIYGSSGNTIENCIFEHCGYQVWVVAEWHENGYGQSNNNTIRNNIIRNSLYHGIYLYTDDTTSISGTWIEGNQVSGIGSPYAAIRLLGSSSPAGQISNTTVRSNALSNCRFGFRISGVANWSPITYTGVNTIANAGTGIRFDNLAGPNQPSIGGTVFETDVPEYIRLGNSTANVDATAAWFKNESGGSRTYDEIEDRVWHDIDNLVLGHVNWNQAYPPESTTLFVYATTGSPGASVSLTARLTLTTTGDPLPGRKIIFKVSGDPNWTLTGVTGTDGIAYVPYVVPPALGEKQIVCRFAGQALFRSADGIGTLTVTGAPTAIIIKASAINGVPIVPPTPDPIVATAGDVITFIAVGNNGVDYTNDSDFDFSDVALGTWGTGSAHNQYTCQKAGGWGAYAVYNVFTDDMAVTVNHAAATSLAISPTVATVAQGGEQPYIVTVGDNYTNQWFPTVPPAGWHHDGQGNFNTGPNTYTAADLDGGNVVHIYCVTEGLTSNTASLTVTGQGVGPGYILGWDKDTQKFYLCLNAGNPESGTEILTGTNTYNIIGRTVTVTLTGGTADQTATINNCSVSNSLRVRWYFNGGALYRIYGYSTITGVTQRLTWTAPAYPFVGPTHKVDGYSAGPPATWGSIAYSALDQP